MVMAIRLAPISAMDAAFAQRVIDLLRDQIGFPMTEGDIARQLHVFPLAVRPMLALMVERGCVDVAVGEAGVRTYVVVPALQQKVRQMQQQPADDFKPLSASYHRMMAFAMSKR